MDKLFTRRSFTVIVILVDLIIIYSSIFFSYFLFENSLEAYEQNFYAFISISPYIGLCYLILNQIFELEKPRDFTFWGVAYSVGLVIICLLFITMALSFFAREFAYPRSILVLSSFIQIILLSYWHLFVNKRHLKENIKRKVLVVGFEQSKPMAYKLLRSGGMWSKVHNICSPNDENIDQYIKDSDVVFIAEDVDEEMKQNIVGKCVNKHINVFYEPKNPEILLFNTSFAQIDDTPVLRVRPLVISVGNDFLKRMVDLILSFIAFFVFLIPGLIVAVILKLGGGSVFYKQERVTQYGKVFKIYKFRTMVENAEALSGPVLANQKDPRITRLGNILRATRLDEIPQILNILKGDMSIVGPRPERPFFVEQFNKEIPEYYLRHRVKAGLTGLAQIQGKYNTTVKDKLKYDLIYINGYSFALDIKLIMQTLNILLRKSSTEGVSEEVDYDKEIDRLIGKNKKKTQ
ncbi:sugar transferase [Dysgonomonas sp. 216]|uniref:sugar transferase n=1 Tax=Dysgonomonas sp. 216 TaxID=2302934 RepID=UPI0013D44710|nr:sugar transferase [Dysgonomonas sp. 216]NDW18060.1 sugar transferase [Dysgonomonas sp. 216]